MKRKHVKIYRKEAQVLVRALYCAMRHEGAHIRSSLLSKLGKLALA